MNSFTYSSENLLLTGPNSSTLTYDPLMRLQQIASNVGTTRFAYDGLNRIVEDDGSGGLRRRYVHGPEMDEPILWYEGAGTTDRRFLSSDEHGSVISVTDGFGNLLAINKYDEFGIPQLDASGININAGRFQYTGQAWVPEIGVYYYKARMYSPTLGRFLQADPIGYSAGLNLYAYVANDPINFADPLGLVDEPNSDGDGDGKPDPDIPVVGSRGNCSSSGWICLFSPQIVSLGAYPTAVAAIEAGSIGQGSTTQNANQCPAPSNVNISGRIVVYGASAAYARFDGTLTDVSTGESYSISAHGPGGGFAVGSYQVSGTVMGFDALDQGFSLSFWEAGYGPLSVGGATISTRGDASHSVGNVSVGGELAAPFGAVGLGFRNVNRTQKTGVSGCGGKK